MPTALKYCGIVFLFWFIAVTNSVMAVDGLKKIPDWQLVGTVTGSTALAIIRIKGEVDGIYQLDSNIHQQYKITAINKTSVTLHNKHQSWQLHLMAPQSRKIVPARDTRSTLSIPMYQYQMDKKTFDSIRTDRQSWLNNIRLKMVIEKGALTGYQITAVQENSPIDLLGLAKGDIIRGINQIPVRDSSRFMDVFATLKHVQQFSLNVEQNNTAFTLLFLIK